MIVLMDPEEVKKYPVLDLGALLGPEWSSAAPTEPACDTCAAYRTEPELSGNLRVDPEIHLPSPGMDVEVAYFYNANVETSPYPFGAGRTISPNLSVMASGSPLLVTFQRGNGSQAVYQDDSMGDYIASAGYNQSSLATFTYEGSNYWRETTPAGISNVYPVDISGNPTSILYAQDAVGNLHTFQYDSGLLTSLQDAVGRLVTFLYDGNPLLQSIQDWAGRITTFQFDTASVPGNPLLTTVIGPSGCQTAYGYDDTPLLNSITDPNGYATTYAYDGQGRVIQRSVPGNGMTQYIYSPGQTVIVQPDSTVITNLYYDVIFAPLQSTDPTGVVMTHIRNQWGQEMWRINPVGAIVTSLYNINGVYCGGIDPLGNQTNILQDIYNNPTTIIFADGGIATNIYGYAGSPFDTTGATRRLQAAIDQLGNVTSYLYNGRGQVAAMQNPLGQITSYGYDSLGNQINVTDPLGNVSTRLYDLAGNVVGAIDPLGNQGTLTYDPQNRLLSASDPLGNITSFAYDSVGNRILRIDPLGYRTSTIYNVWDKPVSVQDPLGYITSWSYDVMGRPVAMQNALGFVNSTLYDAAGRVQGQVDALGNIATTLYDLAGRPVMAIDQLGFVATTVYDLASRVQATIDARGNISSTVYDALNRVIATQDALSNVSSLIYDLDGRTIGRQDALGRIATTVYDTASRVLAQVDPLGNYTSFAYDAAGRRVSTQDARGNASTSIYDAAGRVLANQTPLGYLTTLLYDAASRPIARQDAFGNLWTAIYDANGRMQASISPQLNPTTFLYDGRGMQIATIDGLGTIVTSNYDPVGRLSSRLAPVNGTTQPSTTLWLYDAVGRPLALVNELQAPTTNLYDARGSILSVQDTLGAFTSFAYDPNRNLILRTDARGIVTSYTNDALNRQVGLVYPSGSLVTNIFDAVGRQIQMADSTGATNYGYDDDDRQSSVQYPTGQALTYGYDAVGNRIGLVDSAGGLTTYAYDAQNRLAQIVNPWNEATTFLYDALNREQSKVMANGVSAAHTYFPAGMESNRVYLNSAGAAVANYTMAYDQLGRLLNQQELDGGTLEVLNYAAYYLGSEERENGSNPYPEQDYTFGGESGTPAWLGGNITNKSVLMSGPSYGVSTYVYDGANALVSLQPYGGTESDNSYDANGNLILENAAGALTSYSWDEENRLTGIGYPTAAIETYAYAADGQRRSKQTGSGTTLFVQDGQNILQETDVNLVLQAHYTDFPGVWGGLTSMRRGGLSSFYVTNPQNSTQFLLDGGGSITDSYFYTFYGALYGGSGSTVNPFQWNGQFGYYQDQIDRYYVRARNYRTDFMRWISRDLLGVFASDWNLPRYCGNDPGNYVDPAGFQGIIIEVPVEPPGWLAPDLPTTPTSPWFPLPPLFCPRNEAQKECVDRWQPTLHGACDPARTCKGLGLTCEQLAQNAAQNMLCFTTRQIRDAECNLTDAGHQTAQRDAKNAYTKCVQRFNRHTPKCIGQIPTLPVKQPPPSPPSQPPIGDPTVV